MAELGLENAEVYRQSSSPKPEAFAAGDVICISEPWVWSFQYKFHKTMCAACFRESNSLKTCSRCKLYCYCNSECQAASWEQEHKQECSILKQIHARLAKVRKYKLDHDCVMERWTECGCPTAQILMAKIVNKLMGDAKGDLSRSAGKLAAAEIMEALPSVPVLQNPQQAREINQPVNLKLCEMIWPDVKTVIPNFDQLMKKVTYNAFPIYEQRGKSSLLGLGIFPQAPYREMTAVCWEMNVTMDLQGRTLTVRATEDIPVFTGLRDLRQAESFPSFVEICPVRRRRIDKIFGHPCTCRICTPEYQAVMTPLKCSTSGCTERIPSDQRRANQPCPQCGAVNADRLKKLQTFIDAYNKTGEEIYSPHNLLLFPDVSLVWKIMNNIQELDDADIVYPDAYFRFVSGFCAALMHLDFGGYETTWKHLNDGGMIDCVRALYPEYHIGRARHLVKAGAMPYLWAHRIGEEERQRLKSVFDVALPQAFEWLKEAQRIYEKLGGENSQWAQEVAQFIAKYCVAQAKGAGESAGTVGKVFYNWDEKRSIFDW